MKAIKMTGNETEKYSFFEWFAIHTHFSLRTFSTLAVILVVIWRNDISNTSQALAINHS